MDQQNFLEQYSNDVVEKVNPINLFYEVELRKRAKNMGNILYSENPFLASQVDPSFIVNKANKETNEYINSFFEIDVNRNLKLLLDSKKKRDQIKLLKGIKVTPDEFTAFIFIAFKEYDYLFSRYWIETLPNSMDGKQLPKVVRLKEDDSIDKLGNTDLTDGQLKNLVLHRKVNVSNFLERGNDWHCFFTTYNSLAGRENWKDGTQHYHYISSEFGISKDDFIDSIRKGNYKSTPIHIELLGY